MKKLRGEIADQKSIGPLSDSLAALTGGQPQRHPMVNYSPDAEGVGGEYDPGTDKIYIAPSMAARRDVLTHEYGHRYDVNGNAANPANRLQHMIPAPAVRPDGRHTSQDSVPGLTSSEYAADTFQNAVQYLQSPESRGKGAIEALGKAEARNAGTGDVVRALLQEPVYSNHPLRNVITPPKASTASLLAMSIK